MDNSLKKPLKSNDSESMQKILFTQTGSSVITEFRSRKKDKLLNGLIHAILALLVMVLSVFVRMPSAYLSNLDSNTREIFMSESGLPYFTDLDSYYHVRLVDNYLKYGSLGDSRHQDGTMWDSLRFYPEGSSVEYQPGIVRLAVMVWKAAQIFGDVRLDAVEFSLTVLMSALTALAAYLLGCRLGGKAGGLLTGILVGCGPAFVSRTLFGRFDTDMFTVLMELLLILFLTEALRAKSRKGSILYACGFALTVALYAKCWMPKYSMLFAGLTLLSGFLFLLIWFAVTKKKATLKNHFLECLNWNKTLALFSCTGLMILAMFFSAGAGIFSSVLSALSFSTSASIGTSKLPNLFVSVSELGRANFLPENSVDFFTGYHSGIAPSVVSGVGGGVAFLMSVAGLILLGSCMSDCFRKGRTDLLRNEHCCLYFCVLSVWFFAGLYLTQSGIRFIYHLSVAVGPLAGFAFSRFVQNVGRKARAGRSGDLSLDGKKILPETQGKIQKCRGIRTVSIFILRKCLTVFLFLLIVFPAIAGSILAAGDNRPSVTDASENAMKWMREKNADPVIATWWDMGYYYEYASGCPCLWDGGTQDSIRAVLMSKSLTADNLEFSHRILKMLAGSGNAAVKILMEHSDEKTAFETLWEVLPLEQNEAVKVLMQRCSFSEKDAAAVEALIHPEQTKDIYFVITYTMTRQIGWYEFFADWDFTGTQKPPAVTWYSYLPDGTSVFDSETGQDYLENVRSKETIWRLFFNAESNPWFTPAFEWHDGMEHVRIWHVES